MNTGITDRGGRQREVGVHKGAQGEAKVEDGNKQT